jgi:predicted kinase
MTTGDRAALVLMHGAPGSGKSSWVAGRFAARDVFSLDALRRLLSGAELEMDATGPATAMLRTLVEYRMGRRLLTVIDSTHTRPAYRWPLAGYARAAAVPVVAVVMDTPLKECLHRNAYRGRIVTPAAPYAGANGTEVPPDVVARLHAEAVADPPRAGWDADPPRAGWDADAVLTVTHDGFFNLAGDLPPALMREPWLADAVAACPTRRGT